MRWQLVNVFVLCLALYGCKTKVRTLDYLQSNQTHWGEYVNAGRTLSNEIEEIWVNPTISLRGDSVTIPPCPPATSFHYVWLPQSDAPSRAPLVPAIVRKVSRTSVTSDTTRHSDIQSLEEKKEVVNVSQPSFIWSTFVKKLVFVGIICLFVYFVCRSLKNSLPLH